MIMLSRKDVNRQGRKEVICKGSQSLWVASVSFSPYQFMESAWDSGNPHIKISSSVKGREKLVAGRKEISGEGIDTFVEKFLTFSKFHRGSLLNRQPPESAGWMCGPGLCILTLLQAPLIQVASRPPLSDSALKALAAFLDAHRCLTFSVFS